MFKNFIVYRVTAGQLGDAAPLEKALQGARFIECGPTQDKSMGWVEPRGQAHAALLEVVDGQWIAELRIETRAVPASVVNRMALQRADQIQAEYGRQPGRKELRDIKDDIRLQLLPQAFTKQTSVRVWLDRAAGLVLLDTASQSRADDVMALLLQALPGISLALIDTREAPATAMAHWLLAQQAPGHFSLDRECELRASDATRALVRYARHRLDTAEVQGHVQDGKLPTRLALTWQGRVSFVLTESLQIKKIGYLEGVFENTGATAQDDHFDADVAIATGEWRQLLPELLDALGGMTEPTISSSSTC